VVRYGDDIILLASTADATLQALDESRAFLTQRLKLRLNTHPHPVSSLVVPTGASCVGACRTQSVRQFSAHATRRQTNVVFDMIEEFRPQAVDRVIFGMITKGEALMRDPKEQRLTRETVQKVIRNVLERLATPVPYRRQDKPLQDVIQRYSRVSPRRAVWTYQPDPALLHLDSCQHCRGMWKRRRYRVCSFSANGARISQRTGLSLAASA
jgi:hypothetical protein